MLITRVGRVRRRSAFGVSRVSGDVDVERLLMLGDPRKFSESAAPLPWDDSFFLPICFMNNGRGRSSIT